MNESSNTEKLTEWEDARRIELFLDVKPWICTKCDGKNFGRMKFCVPPCRNPRPADWKFQKRNE